MIYTKQMFKEYIEDEYKKYEFSKNQKYTITTKDKISKKIFSFLGNKKVWIPPTKKMDGRKIKNVVIFRYDAIGDYITTSAVIRWLKAAIPDVKIDIISSQRNHILASADPLVHKAYSITYAAGFSLRMFKILKFRKIKYYDLLFSFVYWQTTKSAILSKLMAPDSEKVTVKHHHRTQIYGLVFDRLTEAAIPGLSWAQRMAKCAIENIEPVNKMEAKDANPYIFISDKNYENILPIIKKNNLKYKLDTENIFFYGNKKDFYQEQKGDKYIVINIAGSEDNRIWDIEKVVEYCEGVFDNIEDCKIFVTGGPKYKAEVDKIVEQVGSPNCNPINVGLLDFISFTAGAYFVVTPDTGVVHFAAAANVPLIVLFAEKTKILEWHPHNTKNVMMLSPDKSSINLITNDEMIEATKMLVAEIENN